jgi:hypothetical protein
MRELIRIARNQKQIEHEGFYHGSQGCEPTKALAEIENHFNQQMEVVSHKATPRIKHLEAVIDDSERHLPAAKERLNSIMARLQGRLPEVAVPAFMVLIGIFAMIAESVMLGPFMDIFDITDPFSQRVAAFSICGACAILLHQAIESLTPGRFHLNTERLLRTLGVLCLLGLLWAGIARGRQAAYGAALNNSPLAGFLQSYPVLGMLVYAFFTVAFPVAAALAITFGVKTVREWREFLAAKRAVKNLTTALATAPKQLESEQKKLGHERNKLEQLRHEWQNSYLVQHERGSSMGAAQTPKWMVWLKATVAALITLLVTLPLIAIPVVPIVFTLTTFVGAWAYFHQSWAHPKPHQLYRQQKVKFRDSDDNSGGSR